MMIKVICITINLLLLFYYMFKKIVEYRLLLKQITLRPVNNYLMVKRNYWKDKGSFILAIIINLVINVMLFNATYTLKDLIIFNIMYIIFQVTFLRTTIIQLKDIIKVKKSLIYI